MWNEINNSDELSRFLLSVQEFHDSCIKEMYYVSGAYVQENLSMFPVNSRRILRMVIQLQQPGICTIEFEFSGLKYLRLAPTAEPYSCEILDATMILNDKGIIWCDCGGVKEEDIGNYLGTVICAEKARWRNANEWIGPDPIYG